MKTPDSLGQENEKAYRILLEWCVNPHQYCQKCLLFDNGCIAQDIKDDSKKKAISLIISITKGLLHNEIPKDKFGAPVRNVLKVIKLLSTEGITFSPNGFAEMNIYG